MPRGDGTGFTGSGGIGLGRGIGIGGRTVDTRPGSGPGGECVCPNCGARVSHKAGNPCYNRSCPECGAKMGKRIRIYDDNIRC